MDKPGSAIFQLFQGIFPFCDLDQKSQTLIAPFMERSSFQVGTTIFEQDDSADAIYFILSGHIEIVQHKKKSERVLLELGPGDHFGEDVLANFAIRQTSAVCKSRVMVLKISHQNLKKIYEGTPILRRTFALFLRSYRLLCKLELRWREPQETLYLLSRRSKFFLWIRIIPLVLISFTLFGGLLYFAFTVKFGSVIWLILAFLALGMGIFITGWAAMEWSNDYFILTRERVLMQRQLVGVYDSRQETPMSAVLSTGLDRSFIGRLFGFGTVTARAYTGDLRLGNLPDPDLIFALLENRRKSILAEQRRQEQEGMQSLLQNRLKPVNQRVTQPVEVHHEQPIMVNYYSGSFFDFLAKFFVLRTEKDGAVIYRTHWWMLFRKTFLPGLFLLFVVGVVLARFAGAFALDEVFVYFLAIVGALIGWGWWFFEYIDWHNDVYIITPDQLMDVNRRPLGSEQKRSAPVKNIQTVEYERKGIIALLLNFGTVGIKIGNEEFTFDNVYNPSAVQIEIFNRFREGAEHSRKMDQKRIADYLSIYDGIRFNEKDRPKDKNNAENE